MKTPEQIVVLAGVGLQTLDKGKLTIATAIALAESSGNETNVNINTDGSRDDGLWQINSVHRKAHPEWTPAWLHIPENNARAMSVVSGGGSNWQPWSAYKNGAYQRHMDRARRAVDATPTATGTEAALAEAADAVLPGDPLAAIAGIVEPVMAAAKWIGDPSNWTRVVQVMGGVALGLVAISIVIKPVVESSAGTAAKAYTSKGFG